MTVEPLPSRPPNRRLVEYQATAPTGQCFTVPLTLIELAQAEAPIAYEAAQSEFRSFDGRVFCRWYNKLALRGMPQFQKLRATPASIISAVEKRARRLKDLQPGDQRHELGRAAANLAVIDGHIWVECGEPVYEVRAYSGVGPLDLLWGVIFFQHSPNMKVIHDNFFAADAHEAASATLREWHGRGVPYVWDQALPLPRIAVTGTHLPGSTWRAESVLGMQKPDEMNRAELGAHLSELNLRLSLIGALRGPNAQLGQYDSERLTTAQEDVVLAYFGRAAELDLDPNIVVWDPPPRFNRRR